MTDIEFFTKFENFLIKKPAVHADKVSKIWIRSSLRRFPVYLEFVEIPIITV
jgi:hypothetical protein